MTEKMTEKQRKVLKEFKEMLTTKPTEWLLYQRRYNLHLCIAVVSVPHLITEQDVNLLLLQRS